MDALEIDAHFNKKFVLSDEGESKRLSWSLPSRENIYFLPPWTDESLIQIKKEMNDIKNQLSDKDIEKWSRHTSALNISGNVVPHVRCQIQPELCTQAWCKFYEVLCSYPLCLPYNAPIDNCIKAFNSLHLCEAPGAFIAALNHYLKLNFPQIKLCWLASSLNPYFEGNELQATIQDDRFIRSTFQNWNFGADNTGNILIKKNRDGLCLRAQEMGDIHLITADGSVDCQNDPGEQEGIVAPLQICETLTALNVLSVSGSFVLKMFSFYEHSSACLLYLLVCTFEQVHVFKPGTSSSGNSEVYVIALRYRGRNTCMEMLTAMEDHIENGTHLDKSLFAYEDLPSSFLKKVVECAIYFKHWQSNTILENLRLFGRRDGKHFKKRSKLKVLAASNFIFRYGIGAISDDEAIVGSKELSEKPTRHKPLKSGSYFDRLRIDELSFEDKLNYMNSHHCDLVQSTSNFEDYQELIKIECVELCVTFGKEFEVCWNSAFCDVSVLLLHNQLVDCYMSNRKIESTLHPVYSEPHFDGILKRHWPIADSRFRIESHESSCDKFVDELKSHIESLGWESRDTESKKLLVTFLRDHNQVLASHGTKSSWTTIQNFCAKLKSLNENDDLFMLVDPLLTRVDVGLVYILTHAFEKVELFNSHNGESKAIAFCFNYKESTRTIIKSLERLSTDDNMSNVLEVVSIIHLLDQHFFNSIYTFNCHFVSKLSSKLIDFMRKHMI